MTDVPPAGQGDTARLPRLLLHVVFVVDGSGSMAGERIASLNWAAKAAVPALRDQAADHPEIDLRVRVLRFGSGATWITAEPTPIDRFTWTSLSAGGESDMGAALSSLATAFAMEAVEPVLPPVIILLSDGLPTDDVATALAALLATAHGARSIRIPIAIGQDADLDVLAAFGSDPALKPLRADTAETLVARIRWAATVPVEAAAAAGAPVTDATAAGTSTEPDEGIVW